MPMSHFVIESARVEDLPGIRQLLDEHQLPADGIADRLRTTLVARQGPDVVGSAALEVYGDDALLRSVAVARSLQHHGVGATLLDRTFGFAREGGIRTLYLLTTTAERYFPRFGFEPIQRDQVPAAVRGSVEFTAACPASAVVMRKAL
jgi:amino-acid N-acetyltransferase